MIVKNTMQSFMDKLKDATNDPRVTEQVKHTPGPWQRSPHSRSTILDANMHAVCDVVDPANGPEFERNAYLIAAAPELLIELEHTARNLRSMIYMLPVKTNAVEREALAAWLSRIHAVIYKVKYIP